MFPVGNIFAFFALAMCLMPSASSAVLTTCPRPAGFSDPNAGNPAANTVYYKHFGIGRTWKYLKDNDVCNGVLPGARLAKWRNQNEWNWIKGKSGANRLKPVEL